MVQNGAFFSKRKRRQSVLKRIHLYFISFIFIIFALPSFILSAETIKLEEITIETTNTNKQPLTTTPIEMYGPTAEANFYYEITSDISDGEYFVEFSITKSSLLIEPSSLTIEIDGIPVRTVSLTNDSAEKIRVDLKNSALDIGIHTITANFSGYVVAGVCTPQNTSGNWITIQPSSYIQLATATAEEYSLADYPQGFTGSDMNVTTIIIPSNSTTSTLQSAHMVANYLSALSSENSIQVLNEDEVKALKGNVIIVGAIDEFDTTWTNEILAHTNQENWQEGTLDISQHTLTQNKKNVRALLVTSQEANAILDKIKILTHQALIEQLSGESLQIIELPVLPDGQATNEISFQDFGLEDTLLDGQQAKTQTYYSYLPIDKNRLSQPSIELLLKRSDRIKNASQDDLSALSANVEFIVYINEVPHAVDMHAVEEDTDGNISVKIPLDKDTLQENRLVSMRLETSGLRTENPCIATDQNNWIYVYQDSKLVLPANQEDGEMDFNHFPFPFSDGNNNLIIAVPEEGISNQNIQELFNIFTINNQIPPIQLLSSSDLTEEHMKKGNIVFIGSIKDHAILRDVENDLIVRYDEYKPLLGEHGFIDSEVDYYSFIQTNPWNEDYMMVVFDYLKESQNYVTSEFMNFLFNTSTPASIAVQTGPSSFYTNSLQLESVQETNDIQEEVTANNEWVIWGVGFLLLLATIAILIFVVVRRKRIN